MKEMFLIFVACLVAGAVFNGLPDDNPLKHSFAEMLGTSEPEQGQEQQQTLEQGGKTEALPDSPLVYKVTNETFKDQVLDANEPVLVEFYMDSDNHCQKMVSVVNQLATEFQGSLKVVKVDIMNNPVLMQKYDIGPLPGFVLIKGGKKMIAVDGEYSKNELKQALTKVVPLIPSNSGGG